MPSINLELLAESIGTYNPLVTKSVELINHVHKRIEQFHYRQNLANTSVPIVYLDTKQFNSKKNLQVINKAWQVPLNNTFLASDNTNIFSTPTKTFNAPFKRILATNKTFTNSKSKEEPLFYKHVLPENTEDAYLEKIENGNKKRIAGGYVEDYSNNAIYTNLKNAYDQTTYSYTLYYVVSVDSAGVQTRSLLNSEPVANEATWEDLDPETGDPKDSANAYYVNQSGSGFVFSFVQNGPWYIKPLEHGLIQPRSPDGFYSAEPWFMNFSIGDFYTTVNNAVYRYYIPEFAKSAFTPYSPILFANAFPMFLINKRHAYVNTKSIFIRQADNIHLIVRVYDANNVLIKLLTTNENDDGKRFNKDIHYEYGRIVSWDSHSGIVAFDFDLSLGSRLDADFYYTATHYSYTDVDLNPVLKANKNNYSYVYYLIPNANVNDKALHHLILDDGGNIIYTSQGPLGTYLNLQPKQLNGSFNTNTVIGKKYISDLEEDTFSTLFTVSGTNSYNYLVLAEVNFINDQTIEDIEHIDVQREVRGLDLEEAVTFDSKILQSKYGYGEQGQEIPLNGVTVVQPPLTLLEEYGGSLSENEVVSLLKTYHPSVNALIVDWTYPYSEFSLNMVATTETAAIKIIWDWMGDDKTYKVYRSNSETGEWSLIHTKTNPAEATLSYIDEDLEAGEIWYYQVRITQNNIEFPTRYTLSAKAYPSY